MGTVMYKPSEFAKLVNVSVKTLQRWDRTGVLAANRLPSGRRYYTDEQLEAIKDDHQIGVVIRTLYRCNDEQYRNRVNFTESRSCRKQSKLSFHAEHDFLIGLPFSQENKNLSVEQAEEQMDDLLSHFEEKDGNMLFDLLISFDWKYLQQLGLIDPSFDGGDSIFDGKQVSLVPAIKDHTDALIDAIYSGLDVLSSYYEDLHYVCWLSCPTEHVMVHVYLADFDENTPLHSSKRCHKIGEAKLSGVKIAINEYLLQSKSC